MYLSIQVKDTPSKGEQTVGIFSRMTDIINSNINSLLDKAEDPEKIIRLMIQEMEDTLVEVRSSAAKAIADKKERTRTVQYLEQEAIDWEQKAELALRKNRDDLAKSALLEKSRVGDKVEILNRELKATEENLAKLNEDISKLQAKLEDAKARQRTLLMRHNTATEQLKVRSKVYDGRIDDAIDRFESAERKIDKIESEVEAIEFGRVNKPLAEEIVDLERDEAINAELVQLKQRLSQSGKPAKTES